MKGRSTINSKNKKLMQPIEQEKGGIVRTLKLAASLAIIGTVVGTILWILYGEVNLYVRHDYTIARITKFSRSNKFERLVDYTYTAQGRQYDPSVVWNGKALPGERYVVKYATYAPYGNDFLFGHPVPDSIQQDTTRQWRTFLRTSNLY